MSDVTQGGTQEFEESTTVEAAAERVYDFVSDVRNLPKYLPTTESAEPQQGERVRVQGEVEGHEYDSDGYFRKDESAHRLEWGADEHYYSGWLEVEGQGDTSEVTVHLTFKGRPPADKQPEQNEDAPDRGPSKDDIREGLVKSLESIKNFVEGDRPDQKEEVDVKTR